jgi:hypothetical protein
MGDLLFPALELRRRGVGEDFGIGTQLFQLPPHCVILGVGDDIAGIRMDARVAHFPKGIQVGNDSF